MIDWIIYYDDGSTYSNEDGSPYDAPNKGVICIGDRKQACTVHQFNFYYYHVELGVWWGSDVHGLVYQLCNDRTGKIRSVLQGANVDTGYYQQCMMRAFEART